MKKSRLSDLTAQRFFRSVLTHCYEHLAVMDYSAGN